MRAGYATGNDWRGGGFARSKRSRGFRTKAKVRRHVIENTRPSGFYAHEKGLGSIENACRIFDIARSPTGPRLSHQPKAVRPFSCLAYWHHIMKTKETVYINIYQNELKSFKKSIRTYFCTAVWTSQTAQTTRSR